MQKKKEQFLSLFMVSLLNMNNCLVISLWGKRDRVVGSQLRFLASHSFVSNNFGCKHECFLFQVPKGKHFLFWLVSLWVS